MNRGVMFQFFHWNLPADGTLWTTLAKQAVELKNLGATAVWLPPPYKAADGREGVGYGVYDLYDLGEFDQKGTVETKYGSKDAFIAAIQAVRAAGMHAYVDVVLNHRVGADETEELEVQEVCTKNRLECLSPPTRVPLPARYTFPGRRGTYSAMTWSGKHFTGFGIPEHDCNPTQIFRHASKTWCEHTSTERGSFDFLLGADVDFREPEVFAEMIAWGNWFVRTTGLDGFRLDAVKHIPHWFYKDWLAKLREDNPDRELFAVGEYWSSDVAELDRYHAESGRQMRLLDVPLHFNFHRASTEGAGFDLRTIFNGSWLEHDPINAVTFVDNHDTQPGQSLQSFVEDWFKPHAYALILLREQGYPCLFFGDYFGSDHPELALTSHRAALDHMLHARAEYTFGHCTDYFHSPTSIAWTWIAEENNRAMAVLMSTADRATLTVQVPPNLTFRDILGNVTQPATSDANGNLTISCNDRSVSIWCSVSRTNRTQNP